MLALAALVWWTVVPSLNAQEVSESELETTLLRTWTDGDITIVDGLAHVPLSIMAGSTAGTYRFDLTVFDSGGTQLYRDSWERSLSDAALAFAGSGTSTLLEPFQFGVMPGMYAVDIHAYPIDAPDLGTRVRLSIEAYATMPFASDLFLADRVEALAEEGGGSWSITHGGFGIAAVARTTIIPQSSRLSYYVELYGGEEAVALEVSANVTDKAGREVYRTPAIEVEVPVGGTPFAGNLSLEGLPPGDYMLRLDIGGGGEEDASRAAAFRMLESSRVVGREVDSYEATYFGSLTDQELLATFGGVGYLVTEGQRQAFESLPPDAKRRYLTEFFRMEDRDESPTRNSFLEEYLDRLGKVRMLYGELLGTKERPPWLTDAGRIYIRFGEPDERLVNHYPSGSDTRFVGGRSSFQGEAPYQIWSYHSTGYTYVFVEENQFGVWRMVFTTDPNMQSLADWRERLGSEASRDLSTKFGIDPQF